MDYNGVFEVLRPTMSVICGLTDRLLQFQFNPWFFLAGGIVLEKQISVVWGKKSNYVKLRQYEEIRVHFYQILMTNSGNKVQFRGEVKSEGITL